MNDNKIFKTFIKSLISITEFYIFGSINFCLKFIASWPQHLVYLFWNDDIPWFDLDRI